MADEKKEQKEPQGIKYPSGLATLAAYLRGGLKDVQDRIVNPWHGTAEQHAEQGMAAHPTPLEVYEQRHGTEPGREFGVHGEQQGTAMPEQGGVHGNQEEDKQQEAAGEPKQPGWAQRFAEVREQLKAVAKEQEISM